jgi:hypothetical protein
LFIENQLLKNPNAECRNPKENRGPETEAKGARALARFNLRNEEEHEDGERRGVFER